MPTATDSESDTATIAELKEWLLERVADDNDIVVDELQQDFARILADEDDAAGPKGSEEYLEIVNTVKPRIAELKSDRKSLVKPGEKCKLHDGFRHCWFQGGVDSAGRPHGNGMLVYENGDVFKGDFEHGLWERKGKLIRAADSTTVEGSWKNGLMEGEMRVESQIGWVEGYWSDGVAHGFQREFGPTREKKRLAFVGRFHRGVRTAYCWQGLFGGGFLCGQVNSDTGGEFTGKDVAYIYPDFETAVRGEFENGRLVVARECKLIGAQFVNGMCQARFEERPPGDESVTFRFACPTRMSVGMDPLLEDPYEASRVCVKQSTLPQGGEGLFAVRDLASKELISLFNGVRLKTAAYSTKNAPHSDYRIRLNADIDLDIPDECISLSSYKATLGHKANHSNLPNAEWSLVEHPRFGLIRGLSSIRAIEAGEEILVNYHMNLADAPDWYKKVWVRHQREHKKMSNDSIARVLDRYRENTSKHVDVDLTEGEHFSVPEPRGIIDLESISEED